MSDPNGNSRRINDGVASDPSTRESFLYLISRIEAGEINADQWALNHLRFRAGVGPEIIEVSSDSEEEEEEEEEEDDDVVYMGMVGGQQEEEPAQEGSANSVCTTLGEHDEVIQPSHVEAHKKKQEEKRKRMEKMILECHFGRDPRKDDGEAGPSRRPRRRGYP